MWPFLLAATVLFGGSTALGTGHYWASYVLLIFAGACMYAPYGPYFALVPEFLPQKLAGPAMADRAVGLYPIWTLTGTDAL